MKKIGIIGNGFVGSAVYFGFSPQTNCDADVKIFDTDPIKSTHSLEDTVNDSDFIFLSVPSNSNKTVWVNLFTCFKSPCSNANHRLETQTSFDQW